MSLSDGIPVCSFVLANNFTLGVQDISPPVYFIPLLAFEEKTIIISRKKTDILTLRDRGTGEAHFTRLLRCLFFCHVSHREDRP